MEEFTQDTVAFEISAFDQSNNHTKANKEIINTDQNSSDSHQNPKDREGDCCFCCCSHWLMSKRITVPMPFTIKPTYEYITISLPDSPPKTIFHPPCFS